MDVIEAVLSGTTPDWEHPGPAEVAALTGCRQTPRHHAEGDVATHTRMTVELASETAADLDADRAAVLRVAALLHDIGKPVTTVDAGDGTFPARNHETAGAETATALGMTHRALSRLTIAERSEVAALVRHHMWTYHPDRLTPGQLVLATHQADPALQHALWVADTRGRICEDADALADQVAYAVEVLREHDAWRPRSHGPLDRAVEGGADTLDPHVRQLVLRDVVTGAITDEWAAASAVAAAEKGRRPGSLTYTVGLPGLGKSTWARRWAERTGGEVLSSNGARRRDRRLAAIRVDEAIPTLLAAGADVCVDATHLSRKSRDRLVGYAGRDQVPLHAVVLDAPLRTSIGRQASRPAPDAVPTANVEAMARLFRLPTPDEYATMTIVDAS